MTTTRLAGCVGLALVFGCADGAKGDDTGGAVVLTEDCGVTLPSSTQVVRGDLVLNSGSGAIWVCDGGDLILNSGNYVVVGDNGSSVAVNSGTVTLYALDGASAAVNSNGTAVSAEPGASVAINAAGATELACDVIEVDVTAIADGC